MNGLINISRLTFISCAEPVRTVIPPVGATLLNLLVSLASLHADIGYQFVTVGDPGNANDPATGNLYGEVSYVYDIGQYDVTASQYCAFLNAVASTDPYGLYDPRMTTELNAAGISRSGASGSYSYSVIGDGNCPITEITWYDAARFCNWLQNGQPTGLGEVAASTEEGAYTLDGMTQQFQVVTRNVNALYWIPTESEWYKAAYYDPTLNSGAGGYWAYATKSNTAPGNVVGNAINQANYTNTTGFSVTQSATFSTSQNYLTDVGVFVNSASPYGTYDQNGDVFQWNDAIINGDLRGFRGGAWPYPGSYLKSSSRFNGNAGAADDTMGFRIARISAKITAITRLGNGTVVLQCRGFPNQSHTARFSPDLITPFTSLGTATAASDGTFQFTDVNAGSYSKGFYRVTFP